MLIRSLSVSWWLLFSFLSLRFFYSMRRRFFFFSFVRCTVDVESHQIFGLCLHHLHGKMNAYIGYVNGSFLNGNSMLNPFILCCVFRQVLNFSSRTHFTHAIIQPNIVDGLCKSPQSLNPYNISMGQLYSYVCIGLQRCLAWMFAHMPNGFLSSSKINQRTTYCKRIELFFVVKWWHWSACILVVPLFVLWCDFNDSFSCLI